MRRPGVRKICQPPRVRSVMSEISDSSTCVLVLSLLFKCRLRIMPHHRSPWIVVPTGHKRNFCRPTGEIGLRFIFFQNLKENFIPLNMIQFCPFVNDFYTYFILFDAGRYALLFYALSLTFPRRSAGSTARAALSSLPKRGRCGLSPQHPLYTVKPHSPRRLKRSPLRSAI